ncbi:VirB8/TrbF family protein [Serratia symbiotica]|uniref:VirB8/TrbF family protein n=1 Tax=Serratia symbiotica TaxID=138074 RepID=UPI002090217A|nr:VirB8/TrbF family protein [Serratia symbiotica]
MAMGHYGDGALSGKNSEIGLEIAAYTRAAKYFEKSIAADYRKNARSSRILAGIAMTMAFMAILAVLNLTPLKAVVPYVLSVDHHNGSLALIQPGTKSSDVSEVVQGTRASFLPTSWRTSLTIGPITTPIMRR